MAEDTFNMVNLHAALSAMEGIRKETSKTADSMHDINVAMETAARTRAQMGEIEILDPKMAKDAIEMVQELEKRVLQVGGSYEKLLAVRRQEEGVVKSTVAKMAEMAKDMKGQERSGASTAASLKAQQEGQNKITKAIKEQSRSLRTYVTSMAGVQLTLVGIIALILDAVNTMRKLGAMSQQVAAQWNGMPGHLAAANKFIWQIRSGFKRSFEVAGEYVKSLSRAGFTMEQLNHLNKELLAIEFLQGQAVADQVEKIKDLVNNFSQTDIEAQNFLHTARESSKILRDRGGVVMSMKEVVDLTTELADKTKVYNTDLLGTLALFNALARKDVAERLGLGDAPLKIRKEIASTVAGFSKELEDGWKAALGKGASAAARILEFEKLVPAEQFARMAEFITEKTAGFQGETREIATRQLLQQFGFTAKEVQTVLARAFSAGAFGPGGLRGALEAIAAERGELENIHERAEKQRDEYIKQGQRIATALTPLQELLKQWVENNVIGLIKEIRDYLKKIYDFWAKPEKAVEAVAKEAAPWKLPLARMGKQRRKEMFGEMAEEYERERIEKRFGGAKRALGLVPGGAVGREFLTGLKTTGAIAAFAGELEGREEYRGEAPYRLAAGEALARVREANKDAFIEALRMVMQGHTEEAVNVITDTMKKENIKLSLTSQTPPSSNYRKVVGVGKK